MKRARKNAALTAEPVKPIVHRLVGKLLTRRVRVLVVGCGGTGSEVASALPYMHQAMIAHGHPGGLEVLLLDGDRVSETNTVRQPFQLGDVGHPKATLLAHRLNAFWGLDWRGRPIHLTEAGQLSGDGLACDIVIGCVDSRRARRIIRDRVAEDPRVSYWLDIGNNASTGQFVLGQPSRRLVASTVTQAQFIAGKHAWPTPGFAPPAPDRLPTVSELYPETVDANADKGDTRPSCSAVEALTRQEPFVNRAIANQALAMLARLFRYGELTYHGAFVNLETGRTVSLPVSPEHWTRIAPAPVAKTTRKRGAA